MGEIWDAGTKFFHANATIRHRDNLIMELTSGNGEAVTDHKKEKILWEDFKVRLGTSEFDTFSVDPNFFMQRSDGLQTLEAPFSNEEIDNVVKALPNDKSPGLDGFSNEFLKRSWSVIKSDFYNLCDAFHNHSVCLRSINSSLIILIPKVDGARMVSAFRPISLLNSSVKLVTKLLANRLQPIITSLVHRKPIWFHKEENNPRLSCLVI